MIWLPDLIEQPFFVKVDICIYFFLITILEKDYNLQRQIRETRNTLHPLFFMEIGYFSFTYLLKRALPVEGHQPLNTYILG